MLALAAQLQRGGDEVVGGSLRNHAAGAGRAGERDLGNALAVGQRHACLAPKAIDDVEHAGRQQVGNQLGQDQDGDGRGLCRLEHHAVARANRRGQLPGRHQDGEVPRNDLAHHAQRLLDVVRHGVLVDVGEGAFLRAHAACKVAEVVHGERDVGVQRLADRLAVVHGFGIGQQLQVLLNAVGNFQQDVAARGGVGLAPGIGSGVGGVQRQLDVFGGGAGGLGVDLAVDGRDHIEVLALDRGHKLAADEVVVLGLVGDLGASGAGGCVNGHVVCLRWICGHLVGTPRRQIEDMTQNPCQPAPPAKCLIFMALFARPQECTTHRPLRCPLQNATPVTKWNS